MHPSPDFEDPNVARAFDGFPDDIRPRLLEVRALIFDVAAQTDGVGALFETLKWGQPAYLTPQTKSGTTLRLGQPKSGGFAIYVHCQTSLISEFQNLFPDDFRYEGNRALLFDPDQDLRRDQVSILIRRALTYHL